MVCGVHLGLLTGVLEEIGTRTRVSLVPPWTAAVPALFGWARPPCQPPTPFHPIDRGASAMSAQKPVPAPTPATTRSGSAGLMLALATVGFAMNFWAWALLSPLAPKLKDSLHLTSFQQALIVAVPVIVGALGRVPVGALTDRLGVRVMFPAVSFATIVPVLYLGFVGHSSYAGLLSLIH